MKHDRLLALAVPATLYFSSMCVRAAEISIFRSEPPHYILGCEAFQAGFQVFHDLDGWRIDDFALAATWLANPMIYCALLCIASGWRRLAMISSALAVGLALSLFPFGPDLMKEFLIYPAFWLWWGSMIAALLAATFVLERRPNPLADDFGPLKIPELRTQLSP